MYTSRSSIELFQTCPRQRYLHDFVLGTGVVPFGRSSHLVTGSAVHEGVGQLLKRVKSGKYNSDNPNEVEAAVIVATKWYQEECFNRQFYGKGVATDAQQEFTFREQLALVEGLVRAWAIAELPKIIQRYKVVGNEREIVVTLAEGVEFQARVDAELEDLEDGSFYNYSLKTAKEWNDRMGDSYREDLQGITEVWAIEEDAKRESKLAMAAGLAAGKLAELADSQLKKDGLGRIQQYFAKFQPKRVMGVRFCFLVKGNRVQSDKQDVNSLWITYSPLIRGYKRFSPSNIAYAHSWFYPNSENKSGKGALGKGWEPFNVWESQEFTVKSWIEFIRDGKVQPDCGDVIKNQVVTPGEYFRNQREIEGAVVEITEQEIRIRDALVYAKGGNGYTLDTSQGTKESIFPKYRRSCHWPSKCEYYRICYQPEVFEDILGSGFYEKRIPHHRAERESINASAGA